MLSPANIRANVLVKLGELTGKTHALPLVLFSPTARCNSRCVSCDWWRADGARDLSLAEIETLAGDLERAGTRVVVLTGGEPLVRPDVMAVADLFRARGMALQLLTSGLALGRYADDVAARFQTVTVSLDGHTPELYRAIRGVDGLGAVADGVRKLRARRRTSGSRRGPPSIATISASCPIWSRSHARWAWNRSRSWRPTSMPARRRSIAGRGCRRRRAAMGHRPGCC